MSIMVGDMVQAIYGWGGNSIWIVCAYHEWSQTYDLYCPDSNKSTWEDGCRLNNTQLYRKLA